MNRFCSHAPVARPRKTAHSAVATTKQVGAIDLNRSRRFGESPLPKNVTQKEKAPGGFHLPGANSLLTIPAGNYSYYGQLSGIGHKGSLHPLTVTVPPPPLVTSNV